MLREVKPKSARTARIIAKRAPLSIENPKTTLFLKSNTASALTNAILTDLYSLKRPLAIRFTKKNSIHPFEDPASIEFYSLKNDASLFCLASNSKKRPHCLTFIRCFGGEILDMMEALVQAGTARTLSQFGGPKCAIGMKPLLNFSGTQFEDVGASNFALAKSMFTDFFRGGEAKEVDVEGLQYLISFTASEEYLEDGKRELVCMRCWKIVTTRSGHRLPRIEVEEMGPRIDFCLGRVKHADEKMMKDALKTAKGAEATPKKNVETDIVGDKMGKIHLGRQDLDELQTRKMKGLKRSRDAVVQDVLRSDEKTGAEASDPMQEEDNDSVSNSRKDLPDVKRQRFE